jgi:hypothetical protein
MNLDRPFFLQNTIKRGFNLARRDRGKVRGGMIREGKAAPWCRAPARGGKAGGHMHLAGLG